MAKKMESRAGCSRWLHCHGGADRVTLASTHTGGLAHICCCDRYLVVLCARQIATSNCPDQRNHWMRRVCDWRLRWWKLCLAARWFSVWQRALPVPCHQLMLQPSLTSLAAWMVTERSILLGSFWIHVFPSHAAMDPAPALS